MGNSIFKECFVIMPTERECRGYENGHFRKVYDLLIKPAIENAGMTSISGNELKSEKNLELKALKKIINAPVVVCDLSSLNPKVALGLSIRKTFKRPTILLWDDITPKAYNWKNMACIDYQNTLDRDNLQKVREELKISILDIWTALN
ncbi:hypothetical protein [Bacteroides sp. 519]|uniref:hypothetical protein n=1 Tax=Bacteroides sp. 519 TaxID=2302937 RepID=UPI0013D292FF|nr:hypothetical protein [Bacteroides sp. 519]NDV59761.1 hypothetical protein [Bacteroides sp. 519]